jgi:[acyl-carrier-protein] S-malonyltransferase
MGFAFVFPGQGSQAVGMLKALGAAEPVVEHTFAEAGEVLGYDLWKLVQEGPGEQLNATERAQPAMLAAGVATWRSWQRRGGPSPGLVSGHSLGEFTALVCAGALEFAAAIDLVRFRGEVMQEAVPQGSGSMAAILGLEDAEVEQACREAASAGVVEAVNFNGPSQVVIAGEREAVARAIEIVKGMGAKRALPLPISVPAHSSLMREAGARLAERLGRVKVQTPSIRYISAVDALAHAQPEEVRALLIRHLSSPVRWQDTVRALAATGLKQLIECGPGKVLTGLNRRILREGEPATLAVDGPASIDAALAAIAR